MEITEDIVEKTLSELRCDSATGPDAIPTKIMKECAKQLARPLFILANRILDTGRWPDIWMVRWIVPLHKKNNVYTASNYRGVHLTAQASKVMERVIRKILNRFYSTIQLLVPINSHTLQKEGRGMHWLCF